MILYGFYSAVYVVRRARTQYLYVVPSTDFQLFCWIEESVELKLNHANRMPAAPDSAKEKVVLFRCRRRPEDYFAERRKETNGSWGLIYVLRR